MDWQTYAAAGVVALTVLTFLIRVARRPSKGRCGSSCGCDHHRGIQASRQPSEQSKTEGSEDGNPFA